MIVLQIVISILIAKILSNRIAWITVLRHINVASNLHGDLCLWAGKDCTRKRVCVLVSRKFNPLR